MKKLILMVCLAMGIALSGATSFTTVNAQEANVALIDMEYLSTKIPQYKQATDQIKKESEKWNKELTAMQEEARKMYVAYQKDAGQLTAEQRTARENAIVSYEDRISKKQQEYFGPNGLMLKRQKELIKPIQDKIYEAVKLISERRGYLIVIDRASSQAVIFGDPKADISNDVLAVLGISN